MKIKDLLINKIPLLNVMIVRKDIIQMMNLNVLLMIAQKLLLIAKNVNQMTIQNVVYVILDILHQQMEVNAKKLNVLRVVQVVQNRKD